MWEKGAYLLFIFICLFGFINQMSLVQMCQERCAISKAETLILIIYRLSLYTLLTQSLQSAERAFSILHSLTFYQSFARMESTVESDLLDDRF